MMSNVVRPRTCRQCGTTFEGGPRAWYCPACRELRRREAQAKYREKGRKADRPMSRAWNQAHKDTYYPAKNAKCRKTKTQNE